MNIGDCGSSTGNSEDGHKSIINIKRPIVRGALAVFLFALTVNSIPFLFKLYALSPFCLDGDGVLYYWSSYGIFYSILIAFVSAVVAFVSLIWYAITRWQSTRTILVLSVSCMLSALPIFFMEWALWLLILEHKLEQAEPLITAIKGFESAYGYPPPELQALVPEFLSEIPETGIAAYPNWSYRSIRRPGQPWVLYIRCQTSEYESPRGTFTYLPNKSYPKATSESWYEFIGDWIFVHHIPQPDE